MPATHCRWRIRIHRKKGKVKLPQRYGLMLEVHRFSGTNNEAQLDAGQSYLPVNVLLYVNLSVQLSPYYIYDI
jgi:hypothetical protein